MTTRLEQVILDQLLINEDYRRTVIPFLKPDYFSEMIEKIILEEMIGFHDKYKTMPSREELIISVNKRNELSGSEHKEAQEYISGLSSSKSNIDWLTDETEKFVKDKAVYNAIFDSIEILDGKNKRIGKDAIPKLLQDALSISFDTDIGHNWLSNAEDRWEYYNEGDGKRIPFRLSMMNKITNGGMKGKTLNSIMAETGLGKSIFMCDTAAHVLSLGYNVLYITMEMGEKDIGKRIDANLLEVDMNEVSNLGKENFLTKINRIKEKTVGEIVIKEFPTGVHAGHFRALIEELRVKKGFVPDLLIIDYLGICGSQTMRDKSNSNTFLKTVSEELRDLGKEYDVPVLTGHQVNRSGHSNTDIDFDNVSESIGVTNTLDLFVVMMAPEELLERQQYLFKQLKNRYGDVNYYRKFVVGIEKPRMRFFDVDTGGEYIAGVGDVDKKTGELQIKPKTSGFDSFNF